MKVDQPELGFNNELPWCIPPSLPLPISLTISPLPSCQPKSPRTRAKAVIDPGNKEDGRSSGEMITVAVQCSYRSGSEMDYQNSKIELIDDQILNVSQE